MDKETEKSDWVNAPGKQETTPATAPRGPRGPYKRGGMKERPRQRDEARQDKQQQKGTHP